MFDLALALWVKENGELLAGVALLLAAILTVAALVVEHDDRS